MNQCFNSKWPLVMAQNVCILFFLPGNVRGIARRFSHPRSVRFMVTGLGQTFAHTENSIFILNLLPPLSRETLQLINSIKNTIHINKAQYFSFFLSRFI